MLCSKVENIKFNKQTFFIVLIDLLPCNRVKHSITDYLSSEISVHMK